MSDIALEDYIAAKAKSAVYVPHTAGRYQTKRFRKAQCPIVERLTNSLMRHGRNNGKKLMATRIVEHAMDIINLLTDQNPIQVRRPPLAAAAGRRQALATLRLEPGMGWSPGRAPSACIAPLPAWANPSLAPPQVIVDAIINSGPREDATRIGSAGVVRRQAVDVSPLRRVNQAIWLITTGAKEVRGACSGVFVFSRCACHIGCLQSEASLHQGPRVLPCRRDR